MSVFQSPAIVTGPGGFHSQLTRSLTPGIRHLKLIGERPILVETPGASAGWFKFY